METGCFNGSSKRMLRSHFSDFVVNNTTATKLVDECDNQPKHFSKRASFIKLLDQDFSKQLHIPHEFTTIFNGYVPHRFIIESAMTKKCWRVEVEEEGDGTLYIREGWDDFVEAHSLQVGNLLLFEYEEQSIFQVRIYDNNGCEKTTFDAQGGKHNPVKIIDYEEQEESDPSEEQPEKLRTISTTPQKTRRLLTRKYGNRPFKRTHASARKYSRTAKVCSTGDNMAFSVKIHKSKRHQFAQQTIPKKISVANNLASKDEIIVQNAMGNRWPIKLTHRTDGRSIFSHGWKSFFKQNGCGAGDTLKFEFVSDGLVQVRVTNASHQNDQESEEATSENEEPVAPIVECEDDELNNLCTANMNPADASVVTQSGRKRGSSEISSSSFTFLWRPATAGTYLHVPKIVAEGQNLMNKDSIVLRDPEDKCWPIDVGKWRDGRVALRKGWVEFWKGHNIKAGDSLDFEFVSEYLIHVKINRGKSLKSRIEIGEPIVNLSFSDDDEPANQTKAALVEAEQFDFS